jgi:hypothetical protein
MTQLRTPNSELMKNPTMKNNRVKFAKDSTQNMKFRVDLKPSDEEERSQLRTRNSELIKTPKMKWKKTQNIKFRVDKNT